MMFRRRHLLSGRYELLEELGSGSAGTVHRAIDRRNGRIVAVKLLHPFLRNNSEYLKRFRREAQVSVAIDSRHAVQTLASGQDNRTFFLVMEYVEGASLARVLREQGKPSELDALRIAVQVARALEAAAARGIVHRDIKPDNILIQPNGNVKVADFGVAKATELTTLGTLNLMGTLHYMSPEAFKGEVDARSDIYSLGVVMYELLTGRVPFPGDTPAEAMRQHLEEEPEPLAQLLPELDPEIASLVEKCLAKNPNERPQSALEVRQTIEAAVADVQQVGGLNLRMSLNCDGHYFSRLRGLASKLRSRVFGVDRGTLTTPSAFSASAQTSRVWRRVFLAGCAVIVPSVVLVIFLLIGISGGPTSPPDPGGELSLPSPQATNEVAEGTVGTSVATPRPQGPLTLRLVGPGLCAAPGSTCFVHDERVYNAIRSAAPWMDVSNVLYGGKQANLTMEYLGRTVDLARQTYDPASSTTLLTAAGFPNGADLEITLFGTLADQDFIRWLAGYLMRVGLRPALNFLQDTSSLTQFLDNAVGFGIGVVRAESSETPSISFQMRLPPGSSGSSVPTSYVYRFRIVGLDYPLLGRVFISPPLPNTGSDGAQRDFNRNSAEGTLDIPIPSNVPAGYYMLTIQTPDGGRLSVGFNHMLAIASPTVTSSAAVTRTIVSTAVPPTATPRPNASNRMNCEAIRGTAYSSDQERDWFTANCRSATSAPVVRIWMQDGRTEFRVGDTVTSCVSVLSPFPVDVAVRELVPDSRTWQLRNWRPSMSTSFEGCFAFRTDGMTKPGKYTLTAQVTPDGRTIAAFADITYDLLP